jgi:PAS domain S-box-containing protein
MTRRPTLRGVSDDALFLRLAASTHDLVLVLDERRMIVYANEAAATLTGYAHGKLVGARWALLCGKRHEKGYGAIVQKALITKRPWSGAMELSAKDGSTVWSEMSISPLVLEDGTATGTLCVGRDLRTERGLSQRSWETESQLRSICESMDDGVAVCDAKGTILMCNAAFARLVGYRNDEVVGATLPYPWVDLAAQQTLKNAFRVFPKERSLKNQLVTFRRKDAASLVASLSFAPLRVEGKKAEHVIITARDVTDVQYVQEVRRAADQVHRLRLDVQRKAQRLQTLQDVNAYVLASTDTETIFRAVTDGIRSLVGHDLAGVYLFDSDKEMFFAHTLSKKTPFSRKLATFPLALGQGIIGAAALTGQMVMVNNAQMDPRSSYPPGMRPEKEHFIAVPLRGRISTFGILVVARNRDPEFIEEEAQIVKSFADAATVALENAQLHHARLEEEGERSRLTVRRASASVTRRPAPSRAGDRQSGRRLPAPEDRGEKGSTR